MDRSRTSRKTGRRSNQTSNNDGAASASMDEAGADCTGWPELQSCKTLPGITETVA